MSDDLHDFWSQQSSSLFPAGIADFNRRKADEHAEVIRPEDRQAGILDIACGAGELLEQLSSRLRIERGIDYSASMVAAAQQRLEGRGIPVSREDTFGFLREATSAVWTSTCGVNQYLDEAGQGELVDLFTRNASARAMYLFDTIDPLKYHLYPHGLQFRGTPKRGMRMLVRRLLMAGRVAAGAYERLSLRLPQPGMGYGYQPGFWYGLAARHGLDCEILGSRFYEYTYHVILWKGSPPAPVSGRSA